ncbi:hypothetical protein G1H11_11105 [Phytoactinopolyspora alkaliphila]|uniref:Uncharacterized protein n=1 Tax=Phytoactinopolyspora alkaliphila TaxID=1783498 RepID=A0A6N9YLW5_9ACTN|nr:hypothetical protein [Phytoactinopolyspora alkaliphila]NED95859.1 hypothetical protein [Phytoactinopolyspora alkaliphila]
MAADSLMLTEALLAELHAVHAALEAANDRAYEAVVRATAVRDTLRHEHDRHTQ